MALAKDHPRPPSPFYISMLETGSPGHFPHISPYRNYNQQDLDDLESPNCNRIISNHQVINHSPPLSSSSSANSSNGFTTTIHNSSNYEPHEEAHSLINFKSGYRSSMHNNCGSFLSFQHEGQSANQTYQKQSHPSDYNHHLIWDGSNTNHQHNQLKQIKNSSSNISILDEVSHLQSAGSDYQDASNEWLFNEAYVVDSPQEFGEQQTCFNKRPHREEESMQASNKKQCTSKSLKKPAKSKTPSTTKDPQSIAARNRRERISERLKALQDLVPNGSKVDLVTMLEKAIGYVKFLQLQVKVLATDEFWPAAGGKAPDISQVRQAIDAILTSSRSSEGPTSTSSK